MSLDNLISKYLDGELNQEEDLLLRHYLTDDKAAKEDFDIAVELNHAMHKDANSIKAPADLLSETEDRIMMQIINDSKANVLDLPKVKKSKFNINYRYVSAAAVLLFMFAIGKISDYQIGYPSEYAQMNHSEYRSVDKEIYGVSNVDGIEDQEMLVMEIPKEQKFRSISSSTIDGSHSVIATSLFAGNNRGYSNQVLENKINDFNVADINISNFTFYNQESNQDGYNALNGTLLSKKNYNEPKMPSILPATPGQGDFNYYDDLQYQLTSGNVNISFFAATDYSNSGYNKTSNSTITNYSLSISYAVEDNLDVGIELGNLAYLSKIDVVVRIPNPTPNQMIEVGSIPTEYIDLPRTINLDNQIFWLSAFTEHNIIPVTDNSWFNLSARLGLGASNSGALFYGRVRGKLEIYNNLFLTVGTEMRYMYLNFGQRLGGTNWSRAGFLVYGFEYNLR